MNYRVEELARASGLRVDTIRFYQGKKLIEPPRREGRSAVYDGTHLARLARIRELHEQGFTLAQIRRLLDGPAGGDADESLLRALVDENVGPRTLSRAELAAESGVPERLIDVAQRAGLIRPLGGDGDERFTEADLSMARMGFGLLQIGFPLEALGELAVDHAANVREVTDRAIDLFDDHVRRPGGKSGDPDAIATAFRDLLPVVTQLVAVHFQRTLVSRALERLRASGEDDALREAERATENRRMEVRCAWR